MLQWIPFILLRSSFGYSWAYSMLQSWSLSVKQRSFFNLQWTYSTMQYLLCSDSIPLCSDPLCSDCNFVIQWSMQSDAISWHSNHFAVTVFHATLITLHYYIPWFIYHFAVTVFHDVATNAVPYSTVQWSLCSDCIAWRSDCFTSIIFHITAITLHCKVITLH